MLVEKPVKRGTVIIEKLDNRDEEKRFVEWTFVKQYMAQVFGYTWPFAFVVAAVVAVWIVCNEIISILENLIDIGINLPPFLLPLVKNIKKKAEDVVNVEEENNE